MNGCAPCHITSFPVSGSCSVRAYPALCYSSSSQLHSYLRTSTYVSQWHEVHSLDSYECFLINFIYTHVRTRVVHVALHVCQWQIVYSLDSYKHFLLGDRASTAPLLYVLVCSFPSYTKNHNDLFVCMQTYMRQYCSSVTLHKFKACARALLQEGLRFAQLHCVHKQLARHFWQRSAICSVSARCKRKRYLIPQRSTFSITLTVKVAGYGALLKVCALYNHWLLIVLLAGLVVSICCLFVCICIACTCLRPLPPGC